MVSNANKTRVVTTNDWILVGWSMNIDFRLMWFEWWSGVDWLVLVCEFFRWELRMMVTNGTEYVELVWSDL